MPEGDYDQIELSGMILALSSSTGKSKTNKGNFAPNVLLIDWSKNAETVDNKFICPNDIILFTTISCNSRTGRKNVGMGGVIW
uniref:Uncharacterized protein n=1 Tax=Lactuca sativa TaxID=4236 RepID=A0A9R1WDL8_LACSA|nr:hypothetical protein LSAT_V11C200071850 [Lactuca sativa]